MVNIDRAALVTGRWKQLGDRAVAGGSQITIGGYIAARSMQFAAAQLIYITLGKPDVVLGFIPLHQVQYLEVGRSQDLLQYRSIGAEFLGHQKGGNLGIRIDFIVPTAYTTIIMPALYALYHSSREQAIKQKSTAELKDELTLGTVAGAKSKAASFGHHIGTTNIKGLITGLYSLVPGVDRTSLVGIAGGSVNPLAGIIQSNTFNMGGVGKVVNPESFDEAKLAEAVSKDTNYTSPEDETYDETYWHNTFTITTSLETIFDCYIETIMFRKDIRDGGKMLRGTVLLRQFHPPSIKSSERLVLLDKQNSGKDALQITAEDWDDLTIQKEVITKSLIQNKTKAGKLAQAFGITELDFNRNNIDMVLNRIHQAKESVTNTLVPYATLRYNREIGRSTGGELMLNISSSIRKTVNSLDSIFEGFSLSETLEEIT